MDHMLEKCCEGIKHHSRRRKDSNVFRELENQLTRAADDRSQFRQALEEYKKHYREDDPLKFFLNCCLDTIRFPDKQVDLLDKIFELRNKLPKILESNDSPVYQETDIRILEKFANTKKFILTYSTLVSFQELVKNASEASMPKLYSAFGNILKGTYAFTPKECPTLFTEVDRVLTKFSYTGIPDNFCSEYEKILNNHPWKLTLSDLFKQHRNKARLSLQNKVLNMPSEVSDVSNKGYMIRCAVIICFWIFLITYYFPKFGKIGRL